MTAVIDRTTIDQTTIEPARPADIKRLGNAFCHAKLLLTATELELFADLDRHGGGTAPEIGTRLGLHPRGCRDFLDALTALGLLVRTGNHYDNSPVATEHLLPGGPTYQGGFLNRANRMLYPAWGRLTEALRTGRPQVPDADPASFERMLADPAQVARFVRMMDAVNGLIAPLLIDAFDWPAARHVVDVGGARGNIAGQLLLAYPHLSATVLDLPPMAAPFDEHAVELGVADRIRFVGGDFFTDPLPDGDVLILGHVLHNWSPEERQRLIHRAFEAVRPGGALLIYDAMLDDEPTDLARLLVSLNMLLVTPGGSEYPASQCRQWCVDAGFVDVVARPLGAGDTLVMAAKPAASG